MKKTYLHFNFFFLTMSIAFIFTSCGSDGKDGKYYLSIDDVTCVSRYWDDNSCVPYNLRYYYYNGPCSNNKTFNYEFDLCTGGGWKGTYFVSVNEGEKGGFISDGDDGSNRYYTLSLYSSGKTITYYKNDNGRNDASVEDKNRPIYNVFSNTKNKVDTTLFFKDGFIKITGTYTPNGSVVTHAPKNQK